jgi:hypothetical protein
MVEQISFSAPFPNSTDIEYPVAPAAIGFYKNGPSFMQRHLPLWLSVHAQRAIAVLVTAIALGLPMFRFLPWAYNWITRRRLFYWYAQLKKLEASFDIGPVNQHLAETQAEIERIEDAVSHIRFPLTFSDQLYNLVTSRSFGARSPPREMHRGGWRLNNWNVRFAPKSGHSALR